MAYDTHADLVAAALKLARLVFPGKKTHEFRRLAAQLATNRGLALEVRCGRGGTHVIECASSWQRAGRNGKQTSSLAACSLPAAWA